MNEIFIGFTIGLLIGLIIINYDFLFLLIGITLVGILSFLPTDINKIQGAGEIDSNYVEKVKAGEAEFPWKKNDFTAEQIMQKFENLKKYTIQQDTTERYPEVKLNSELFPLKYKNKFLTFMSKYEDYDNYDVITDYFTEYARMAANIEGKMSPLEFWRSPLMRKVLTKLDEQRIPYTNKNLREALYKNVKECTQFKVSLVVSVLKYFSAKRYLDISAGWGDRLIGALACDLEYYDAWDPNETLKKGHDEIIQFFPSKTKAQITYEPFEDAVLTKTYDLIFSSPPFFNYEIYDDSPKQSVANYSNFADWLIKFLLVSIRKSWANLEFDKHLVIHISDVRTATVCEKMLLLIRAYLPDAKYLGVMLSMGLAGKPRPMWVFQKTNTTDNSAEIAELQKLYPDIYQAFKDNPL